ncbi:uncharacterized protein BO95DRAFT_465676 [Aspergillus brunneoviolaceus CBS 621.78]|uniref:Uncharacterized protein n=2 Tax=Aspergillus TaxID=5052 RepID=A0A8G1VZW8_9EURO|nr:hypothetical protein BO95DRAFT_465676 [Aspergillus brunneoviolaceus CBS 621.78]XP_040802762.1 uncharacterized protein BO72DRAFT_495064 [Aspergillus fijiensis CBS 313.89]RAH43763.1 hypothetical protein BO95DRAFT_465676 [Aspergillus brunneoviolaceus CBS 621.78]RAK78752.1 hypothetical protein BO72DRAFT_495064 [Aspergillus fijiensis CBS 313.89]
MTPPRLASPPKCDCTKVKSMTISAPDPFSKLFCSSCASTKSPRQQHRSQPSVARG